MENPKRRRGQILEDAIQRAALDELAAIGYAGLTMEGVARRAQTGKAAIYRRWPSKQQLVLDAFLHVLPDPPGRATTGSVRDQLVAVLTTMADALAGRTGFPGLDVIAEVLRVPELRNAFASRVIEPRIRAVLDMLQRAAERREIDATRVDALVARTGPALVIETFLLTGVPPAAEELARIVDRVMIPLIVPPTTPVAAV